MQWAFHVQEIFFRAEFLKKNGKLTNFFSFASFYFQTKHSEKHKITGKSPLFLLENELPQDCLHTLDDFHCVSHRQLVIQIRVCFSYKDSTLLLLDVNKGGVVQQRLRGHDEEIQSICWCPQLGEDLATMTAGGSCITLKFFS